VNDELERICNEAAVAYFKLISRNLPGGPEENHETLRQDSRCPGRDLSVGHPKNDVCVTEKASLNKRHI
jgi:hypothetical protein